MDEEKKPSSSFVKTLTAFAFKAKKLFVALKSLKIVMSMFSMLTFAAAQSAINGWAIGIGITVLILIHELGHVWAVIRCGFPARLPIFIPFLGAALAVSEMADCDRDTEARIGYGGPLIGTIGAVGLWAVAYAMHSPICGAIASLGIFLNLFNMVPVSPFDGGRIMQAVHPAATYFGFFLMAALTAFMRDAGILVFWLMVIWGQDQFRFVGRFFISVAIYAIMIVLFITQPPMLHSSRVEAVVDGLVGLFIVAMMGTGWLLEKDGKLDDTGLKRQNRPFDSASGRAKWGVVWIASVIFQVLCIIGITSTAVKHPAPPPSSAVRIAT